VTSLFEKAIAAAVLARKWVFRAGLPALLVAAGFEIGAKAAPPLHKEVLVFVPAYEASQLYDPTLGDAGDGPVCVWGNYNVFLSSKRYFALRMPNPLVAKPLLAVGPLDVYRKFVSALTEQSNAKPGFSPYTEGADFFIFSYDWRQEMETGSAPQLGRALEAYAKIHERKTGLPAAQTTFVIVTHSMGGLVVRTLLAERPDIASRISRLYLVASPNAGSVKAVRTVVVGPDSLDAYARGFPGVLLKLIPTKVGQNVTKLVGITRPSLYELLPTGDPHWRAVQDDGTMRRMRDADVLHAASWERYWPTAGLEKNLFIDGWLKDREEEGRKWINPPDWEFCQDSQYLKLKALLAQTAHWRGVMGRLSDTDRLMTRANESSRLRVIFSTGVKTPTGVVTSGSHDASQGYYTYDPANSGDGTMEAWRVLDDLSARAPNVIRLEGVPHGRLMIDPQFLNYLIKELSAPPMSR
jgi:pimeloyl-ACP methyl ester carboxylesterase